VRDLGGGSDSPDAGLSGCSQSCGLSVCVHPDAGSDIIELKAQGKKKLKAQRWKGRVFYRLGIWIISGRGLHAQARIVDRLIQKVGEGFIPNAVALREKMPVEIS
jgi:hypothetical protein